MERGTHQPWITSCGKDCNLMTPVRCGIVRCGWERGVVNFKRCKVYISNVVVDVGPLTLRLKKDGITCEH